MNWPLREGWIGGLELEEERKLGGGNERTAMHSARTVRLLHKFGEAVQNTCRRRSNPAEKKAAFGVLKKKT